MKTPWWFLKKTPVAILLVPVSWVYYIVSGIVYNLRKINVYKSRRPVVCVGNILAGGVGKTPVVRAIANYFDAPVVMRGYKKSQNTNNIGDEAQMMARDGIAVHTGDRKSNLVLLNKQVDESGPIIMDDGFQNPSLKKDVSILVFDEKIGCGNGLLLPAGPMRERKSAIKKADAIIFIKGKTNKKIEVPENIPVFFAHNQTMSPYPEKKPLAAFAGIGYPDKFFASLDNLVAKKSFADHYQYTDDDVKKLLIWANKKKALLITTEKDWVRLPGWAQNSIKYAKLNTKIDNEFFVWLKEKLKCQQ